MNNSLLNAFLMQPNTISLFWNKNNEWEVLKHNDDIIKPELLNNGLFSLSSIVSDIDKTNFKNFINKLQIKKLSTSNISTISNVFLFSFLDNINLYYKISCYMNEQNEYLIKIERLTIEESYFHDIILSATNDKYNNSFISEVHKMFKRNQNKKYAIIQFDIENFKIINSQYGENLGDQLIKFITNSLKYICDESQLYIRLSADVFMIITPYNYKSDLVDFIEKLNDNLSGYNDISYKLVFGINLITNNTISKIRKFSDGAAIARQSIKKDALHFYAFYNDDMIINTENELWVQMNMEKALINHEFEMWLQPKFSISTNTIVGAEALVRWVHPEKGIISPGMFISIFESNGFIRKLDKYIWEETCKCLNDWKNNNIPIIPISVNISRKHFTDDEYIKYLDELIYKYNINKEFLELEITETLNESNVQENLELLKLNGYTLLMDDFGSGYSSLNTLKDTKFDVVKIDREFLADFIASNKGQCIVEHTITMTNDIGLEIIAEGVETKEQAQFLSKCGCDIVQGFLYAKPMPVSEFNKLRELSIIRKE